MQVYSGTRYWFAHWFFDQPRSQDFFLFLKKDYQSGRGSGFICVLKETVLKQTTKIRAIVI